MQRIIYCIFALVVVVGSTPLLKAQPPVDPADKPHADEGYKFLRQAQASFEKGDVETAERLAQLSVISFEKVVGVNREVGLCRSNSLASEICIEAKQFERAKRYSMRSIEQYETLQGNAHPTLIEYCLDLGDLCKKASDLNEAQNFYSKALKVTKSVYGRKPINHFHDQSKSALLSIKAHRLFEKGDFDEALKYFSLSQQKKTRDFGTYDSSLIQDDVEGDFSMLKRYHDALESALAQVVFDQRATSSNIAASSAEWLMNGKSIGQSTLARNIRLSISRHAGEDLEFTNRLRRVRSKIAHLSLWTPRYEQELKELQSEQFKLLVNATVEQSKVDGSRWVTRDQVKQAIPENGALVDFFRCREFRAPHKDHYVVWITRRNTVEIVKLETTDLIDVQIAKFRQEIAHLADQKQRELIGQKGDAIAASKSLYRLIWEPLEKHLTGCENIVLSPDGPLWLVPWAAIENGNSAREGQFLIESYNFRFVNRGSELVRETEKTTSGPAVVFAHPSFDQNWDSKQESIETNSDDFVHDLFVPNKGESAIPAVRALPTTLAETHAIKDNIAAYCQKQPLLFTQDNALEYFAIRLKNPKIAVFATHGLFLPRNNRYDRDPFLRCGLFLGGCNIQRSIVEDENEVLDDGILTGLEITNIDFRGTELVVLSACDTGVGDIRNGEGVAGLRQAFQLAGAESVLASLWQVDDAETARLMNLFFQNLSQGQSKSQALRQAQLTRIKARRARHGAAHPFFWAAFTLTGQD